MNIDNISVSKFDAVFIPNYYHIYEELKIPDNTILRLIDQFQKANKIIATVGHSTYVYKSYFILI